MKNQWNAIYKKEGRSYKYYDILAPHPDIDRVVKIFKKKKAQKVLDLGCGAGRNLWYLAYRGFKVSGIDLARDGLKVTKDFLKKKKLKAELKVGDVFKKLPYADNSFDAVVSVQVLQHARLEEIKRAIAEIKRVLRPDGLIFVTLCGRFSGGKIRYCLVKTAKKIAPNTYAPTIGGETGLTHYIYTDKDIRKHYQDFKFLDFWKDEKDYYAFVGELKKMRSKTLWTKA